jgi:hypothetical protein
MPRKSEHAPEATTPRTLADKLDDMTLHDETGDPRDEGYMAAVRELRDWLAEHTGNPTDASTLEGKR